MRVCCCMGWLLAWILVACHDASDASMRIDGTVLTGEQIETILSLSPLPSCLPVRPIAMRTIRKPPFWDSTSSTMGDFHSMGGFHAPVAMIPKRLVGWTTLSVGLEQVARHAPTLWNLAWQRWYYWDGRKDSIWSQALAPIEHPSEMEAVVVVPMIWWQLSRPIEIFTSKLLVPCQVGWHRPPGRCATDLNEVADPMLQKGSVYLPRIASD